MVCFGGYCDVANYCFFFIFLHFMTNYIFYRNNYTVALRTDHPARQKSGPQSHKDREVITIHLFVDMEFTVISLS